MSHLVSVLMPCYNSSKTIKLAIDSLINQSDSNWECIIVDDGSSDSTPAILKSITDSRFKIFYNQTNNGRGFSRQVALSHAVGEFIAFLDADDWYLPNKLEFQIKAMLAHPQAAAVACNLTIVDCAGNQLGTSWNPDEKDFCFAALEKPKFLPIPFASTLINATVAKSQKFDPSLRDSEDFDYLLKIILRYPFVKISYPGYVYTEVESLTLKKIILRLLASAKVFTKYFAQFPSLTVVNIANCYFKVAMYSILYFIGLKQWTIRRRLYQAIN